MWVEWPWRPAWADHRGRALANWVIGLQVVCGPEGPSEEQRTPSWDWDHPGQGEEGRVWAKKRWQNWRAEEREQVLQLHFLWLLLLTPLSALLDGEETQNRASRGAPSPISTLVERPSGSHWVWGLGGQGTLAQSVSTFGQGSLTISTMLMRHGSVIVKRKFRRKQTSCCFQRNNNANTGILWVISLLLFIFLYIP